MTEVMEAEPFDPGFPYRRVERPQQIARQFAGMAQGLARMNVAGESERARDWAQMYLEVDDCLRELEPMLPVFLVERGALFRIYTAMRSLKARWLALRREGFRTPPRTDVEGFDPETRQMLHDEEAHLTRIVEHLKRLVAAAP